MDRDMGEERLERGRGKGRGYGSRGCRCDCGPRGMKVFRANVRSRVMVLPLGVLCTPYVLGRR